MAQDFGFIWRGWAGLAVVLMTISTSGYVSCQDDFYFRKWPVSPQGTIRTGQSVELECRVSAEDRISISWTLNGELLANSSRRYQNAVTGDLIIRRADHRLDSGSFACTATNISSGFSIASQPATLNIQWITNTTRIKAAQAGGQTLVEDASSGMAQFNPGDNVVLTCIVDGSGDIQYDWYHNGRKMARIKTKQLVLDPVTVTESGTYTCVAKNGAGHSKYSVPFGLSADSKLSKLVRFSKETVATLNSTVRLPCSFESTALIEWFFRGVHLSSSTHYSIEANGELVVPKVHSQNEGWYHCRKTENGQTEEYGSHLKIAYLKDFSKASIDPPPPLTGGQYYFAEYSTAELTCIAPDGLPAPAVWWEGPSGHILTQVSQSTESVLILNRVLIQDTGMYRCLAGNGVRNVTTQVNLIVTTPPTIQYHPVSVSTNEDETVSISCVFSGVPAPATTVQWFKDGHPFVDSPQPIKGLWNSTLKFTSVSKRSAGNYVCRVKTIGHPAIESQTATLQVREKLKFTVAPVAKTLELGTMRKIVCKAQGSPAPVVRWVKEDPLLSLPSHVEDLNGTLLFHGVKDGDSGQYTCIATNTQGFISTTIFINVTISPNFTSTPNNVTYAKEGQKIELHCRAKGHPVPTIQWDKNSVMDGFTSNRFYVHQNGSLTIESVQKEDEGYYGCTAGNAGGFKRAEFRLVVDDWDHANHEGESIAKTIIITLGAAGAYMLLSVGLLIWCRVKRRQRKLRSENDSHRRTENQLETRTALLSKEDQAENGTSTVDKLNVPSSAITKCALIGKGRFGDVIEGKVTGLNSSDVISRVLLRTLTTRDEELMIEFRRQVDMLHRIRHKNLVAVLGCSRDPADVQTVLMEFHQLSNLKTHLLSPSQSWSISQIQSATVQIARGMNALAQARFVHRDLGTRNILIGFHGKDDQFCLKIGSFGMDKQPFHQDYFQYKHQSIALRWLPHEAIFEDEYSTKSDVWMFAVTVWELYNGARQPLSNRTDEALLTDLKNKTTVWDTSFCKCNALSSLLVRCWSHDPILRPSFDELLRCAEAATTTTNGDSKAR